MATWYKCGKTRNPNLGYGRFGNTWRFVALDDDPSGERAQVVGPQYRSKLEMLADLDRYARDSGWTEAA